MKPSLLNAPFDLKEYQRRMDEMTRIKHGFAPPLPSKVIVSVDVTNKAIFYKWPAYVAPFVLGRDSMLGFTAPTAFARQRKNGEYAYFSYQGASHDYNSSIIIEYGLIHRIISPQLCKLLLETGEQITGEARVKQLMADYPSLTLEEWQALPDNTWPDVV